MADAAQLKLQVGLDLAFFRQQLVKLGQIAAGTPLDLNVRFDRLGIQKELNKLGQNIRKRNYTLEIKTNLEKEIAQVGKLASALKQLDGTKIAIGITSSGQSIDKKEVRKIRTALRSSILGEGGKIRIPATIEAAITNDDIAKFKKAVKEKFSGIKVEIAAELKQGGASAAQQMNNLEGLFGRGKTGQAYSTNASAVGEARANVARQGLIARLEKQSLSKGGYNKPGLQQVITGLGGIPSGSSSEMRAQAIKLAKEVDNAVISKAWQTLESLQAQMKPLRGQRGIEAPRSASNINNILDPIANFTQNPGVARRMLRMLPESQISTNVLDVASRQARYYENVPSAREAQGKIKGFDPLMKAIASNFSDYTRSLSTTDPWIGRIGKGIAQMVSTAATSPQAQKLLPAAGQSSASKMMRSAFAGLPAIQAPSIGQENAPLSRAATYSLNKARRILGMPIGPSSVYAPNPFAGAATVPPTAAASGGFGLPPAGTTSNYSATARRAAWAQAYQQSRPMQAPSVPPPMATGGSNQPPIPPTPPGGGQGGRRGGMGAFPNISLPGAGLVRELGDQFGYATQQVLLFGAAYKTLAFLTDFPSKVGEAVAQLQTFRNTLQAITPNADEFQKSNQFILDTVSKYNTPLQSARDGFINLYASMAPAGFKGDEIRNIFAGISQGAATFGMSADKVDRVNYAFAQMASKGQVMSEELKGQLGDVLPGAVAIFAKAAGFTGPNAMVEFTKAMEDGRYKGEAMKQLLINVGIVMKDKFAKGAEGAAQNFQGQMNAMGNATKKLYEAFEPAGNLFASKVIAPFTSGLQVLTDGFNAFFTGAATKTAGGFALSQELEKLRPTFQGLSENVKQFLPLLQSFATTALGLGKILLQIASNPFVGYMARVYAIILPLNIALNVMRGLWASNAIQLLVFNARVASGTSMLTAFRSMMATTGATSAATAAVIRGAFATTGIGAILVGLGLLIEHFVKMNQALDESRTKALGASDAIRGMSQTELQLKQNELGRQEVLVRGLQGKNKGEKYKLLTPEEEKMVRELSPDSITNVFRPRSSSGKAGKLTPSVLGGQPGIDISMLESLNQKIQSLKQKVDSTQATLRAQDRSANLVLAPIPGAGGVDKAAASALASRQALADKLSADQTKTDIERQKTLFENEKSMINMTYDLREARANSFQKETIRFQKELFNIEMERQKAVLDANSAVTKAQGAVAGGTGGATGLLQGSTGISSGAHFDVRRQDGGYISPQQARALFEASVAKQLQLTSSYGPRRAPVAGASTFHRGVDLAGPTNTPLNLAQGYSMVGAGMKGGLGYTASVRGPQGEMYDVGHLQQPRAGVPIGRVTARQKRVAVADQQTQNALQDRSTKLTLAEAEALKKAEIAMVNYVTSIAPVAEQELQNQLLGKRIELMQSGAPEAFAETQMKVFEAQEKVRIAGVLLDKNNKKEVAAYEELKKVLPGYIILLERAAIKQQQLNFEKTKKGIRDQIDMARALTPEQEMRTQIKQEGYMGAEAESIFQERKTLQSAEKLKADLQGIASTIGTSFGDAFKGIITGSMTAQEALAGFFQNLSNYFADMVSKMIADWLRVEAINGLKSLFGIAGGSGFSFTGDSGFGAAAFGSGFQVPGFAFANGGIATGGFRAFATGGIVTGPTLGLVGEGRYNEAVIPLPDGKSVPVDLGGEGARLGGNGGVSVGEINITVQNTGDTLSPAAQKQIAGQVQGIVLATMADQRRAGGLLR
jgi:tape measure domain-containing protein